jgi:hypothetical protein
MFEEMSSTSSRLRSPEMTYWSAGVVHRLVAGLSAAVISSQVAAQLAQLLVHAAADLAEVVAGEILVEVVGALTSSDGV